MRHDITQHWVGAILEEEEEEYPRAESRLSPLTALIRQRKFAGQNMHKWVRKRSSLFRIFFTDKQTNKQADRQLTLCYTCSNQQIWETSIYVLQTSVEHSICHLQPCMTSLSSEHLQTEAINSSIRTMTNINRRRWVVSMISSAVIQCPDLRTYLGLFIRFSHGTGHCLALWCKIQY